MIYEIHPEMFNTDLINYKIGLIFSESISLVNLHKKSYNLVYIYINNKLKWN